MAISTQYDQYGDTDMSSKGPGLSSNAQAPQIRPQYQRNTFSPTSGQGIADIMQAQPTKQPTPIKPSPPSSYGTGYKPPSQFNQPMIEPFQRQPGPAASVSGGQPYVGFATGKPPGMSDSDWMRKQGFQIGQPLPGLNAPPPPNWQGSYPGDISLPDRGVRVDPDMNRGQDFLRSPDQMMAGPNVLRPAVGSQMGPNAERPPMLSQMGPVGHQPPVGGQMGPDPASGGIADPYMPGGPTTPTPWQPSPGGPQGGIPQGPVTEWGKGDFVEGNYDSVSAFPRRTPIGSQADPAIGPSTGGVMPPPDSGGIAGPNARPGPQPGMGPMGWGGYNTPLQGGFLPAPSRGPGPMAVFTGGPVSEFTMDYQRGRNNPPGGQGGYGGNYGGGSYGGGYGGNYGGGYGGGGYGGYGGGYGGGGMGGGLNSGMSRFGGGMGGK